jgi:hypothetical protein
METYPFPSLVITQSQFILGIFIKPVYVPTSVSIVHKLLQRRISREIREVVLPLSCLSISWSFTNEPFQCLTLSTH